MLCDSNAPGLEELVSALRVKIVVDCVKKMR